MRLADSVKVDDLAVKVVEHFHLGRLFLKEHLGPACKCLHIRRVFRENFNDLLGETVFSAYV